MDRPHLFVVTFLLGLLAAAPLQAQSGNLDASFVPTVAGDFITGVAVQPDGKIVVSGSFLQIDGAARSRVARLMTNGSLDYLFNPGAGANDIVECVAVQPDGKILIAGEFTAVAGASRRGIARLNATGGLDTAYNPGSGVSGYVYSMALQPDGKILIGGDFTAVNGSACSGLARLNTDGSLDSAFGVGLTFSGTVYSLALQQDGEILVGGDFETASGIAHPGAARLTTSGTLDAGFNASLGSSSFVECISVQPNGEILLGGALAAANGAVYSPILRFNSDGSLDSSFNPGIASGDDLKSMALQADGKIVVAGGLRNSAGVESGVVERLQANGSLDPTFFPGAGPNAFVNGLALQEDGQILIGGYFTKVGTVAQTGLARLSNDAAILAINFPDQTEIQWIRGGAAPEIASAAFAYSTDSGATWTSVGNGVGVRVAGGWELTGLDSNSLPPSGLLRATGPVTGGFLNGSSGVAGQTQAFPQTPGTVDSGFVPPVASSAGAVQSIALLSDGRAAIGGAFSSMGGQPVQDIAVLKTTGALDFSFNAGSGVNGSVQALAVQTGNKLLLGGAFNLVNGASRTFLTRLNPNGSPDATFDPSSTGPSGSVNTVVELANGQILVGGNFVSYDGATVNRLARASADGLLDSTFNAGEAGADAVVNAAAVQTDGQIIIGGAFANYDGAAASFIARISSSGVLDSTFSVKPDQAVNCVVIQPTDSHILIGGSFTKIGASSSNGIARLNPDGTLESSATFNARIGATGAVNAIALQPDGKILVGGSFTSINNTTANGIVRLNTDGSIDPTFDITTGVAGGTATVNSIVVQSDSQILIGGSFSSAKGVLANGIARLNPDGTLEQVATFNSGSGINHPGTTVAVQADGRILLAGNFSGAGGQTVGGAPTTASTAANLVRFNVDGTADTSLGANGGANGAISSVAVQPNGQILVAGEFSTFGSTALQGIARLNPDGSVEANTTFQPGNGVNGYVNCLALQSNGKILLGGNFITVGGVTSATSPVAATSAANIARLNTDGSVDVGDGGITSGFNPGAGVAGTVYSIAVQPDGQILVGGNFSSVNAISLSGLARLNPNGSVESSATFNPGAGVAGSISCLAVQPDGKIVAGGSFSSFAGSPANDVVRILANGSVDPNFNVGSGADGTVSTIALQSDGKLLLGGDFLNFDGAPANHVIRLNSDGSPDTLFNTGGAGANGAVDAIALQADGSVLLAGAFTMINATKQGSIARLSNDPSTQSLQIPDQTQVQWLRSGSCPEVEQVTFATSANGGATWTTLDSATPGVQVSRISGGWQLTGLSLPANGSLRVQGQTTGGVLDAGSGIVQQVSSFLFPGPPPVLSSIAIASNNANPSEARAGDVVTISFTANEPIETPAVLIDGNPAVATAGTGNNWTAAITVTSNFPQGPAIFSIVATDPSSNTAPPVMATTNGSAVAIDTIAPLLSVADVPRTVYLAGAQMPDLTAQVSASDANAPLSVTQNPAAGTALTLGLRQVVFTATDPAGNASQGSVSILFTASNIATVATLGGHPPGQLATTEFGSFGTPQTGAFNGTLVVGKKNIPAIYGADGSVLLQVGDAPASGSSAIITSLGQPNGDAVLVHLQNGPGGINAGNNTMLLAGLASGVPQIVAQTGTFERGLPIGVTIKSFLTIDGQGSDIFFLANLQGGAVAPANSLALCVAPATGGVTALVMKGSAVNGKKISVLTTLAGSKGTLAASRWRVNDSSLGVRLTFSDKSEAIYTIPSSATAPADWTLLAQSGSSAISALDGAVVSSFGLPGFGPQAFAVVAYLAIGSGVTAHNNSAILTGSPGGLVTVLARKGATVAADANGQPLSGVVMQAFADPLVGAASNIVCPLTLVGGRLSGGSAILYSADGSTTTLLANAGASALDGGHWATFPSLALPADPGSGPLFTATLTVNKADGVTTANNFGLWGANSAGDLQLLLRTGQKPIAGGAAVKSFTALAPSAGSLGAASGFDEEGEVAAVVHLTDGSQDLLRLALP